MQITPEDFSVCGCVRLWAPVTDDGIFFFLIGRKVEVAVRVRSLFNSHRTDRPFAGSGHMVQNKLHWNANNAVGLPKQRTLTSPARLYFVLEVPLRHLRPSVIYSVPCDRILQRAYYI